jgi:predicted porin
MGSALFNRQAYVGLVSNSLGAVTLGRQYDASVDMVQAISADNFGAAFSTPGDVDNNDNSLRQSNAIKYVSPSYAGFVFEGTYGLSGLAGRPGQGYSYSGGVSYTRGPLSIATTYFQATNPDSTTGIQRTGWAGSADSIFDGSSINNAYESARTLAIYQLGAQYVIGSLTFGGSYSNSQFRPDGQSSFASTERFNNGKAFLSYQLSPQFSMQAGYAYTAASGDTSAKYNQVSLGADYLLSKRTDVYLQTAFQRASGTDSCRLDRLLRLERQRFAVACAGGFSPSVLSIFGRRNAEAAPGEWSNDSHYCNNGDRENPFVSRTVLPLNACEAPLDFDLISDRFVYQDYDSSCQKVEQIAPPGDGRRNCVDVK